MAAAVEHRRENGAAATDTEGGRRFLARMERLYELIDQIEAPYQQCTPLTDAESLEARRIWVELRSFARFVPPLCGVMRPLMHAGWTDWASVGECQECGASVSTKWRGLHCQAGGHRLCWRCIASTIAWTDPKVVAFADAPLEDRADGSGPQRASSARRAAPDPDFPDWYAAEVEVLACFG